ncbi:hypothetical protein BHM03_00027840 [Ensete ventricosum]|nr:hypothetical protein BHM03_00027840 [Ensete ventricosum]
MRRGGTEAADDNPPLGRCGGSGREEQRLPTERGSGCCGNRLRSKEGAEGDGNRCCGWLQPSVARSGRRRGQRGLTRAAAGEASYWGRRRRGWAAVSSGGRAMAEGWRGRWWPTAVVGEEEGVQLSAFMDELALLQKIRHPNVVQFLGAVTQSSPMMIVTEYLPKVIS